jgi:hypothetical protein
MGLEDLPIRIQNAILGIDENGKKTKDKDSYYDRTPNQLHITELLYCLTKSHHSRITPVELNLKQTYPLYRGNVWDELLTSLYRQNQIRCTHRVSDIPATIIGKLDFIDDDGTLCDLKTASSLFYTKKDGGAKEEHKKQVQFYCYCNAIESAKVIYFDFGDSVTYHVEVPSAEYMKKTLIVELEEKARRLWYSLNFFCNFCDQPIGTSFKEGMECPHCKHPLSKDNVRMIPPVVDVKGKEWMCASTDWRTGKIKEREDGSLAINCPYFDKCYKSKEEFESTLNVKASVEPKTVKFSPEKDAPVITVGKKKKVKQ